MPIEIGTTEDVPSLDSANPSSPLHPANPGNALKAVVADTRADVTVSKSVNSAFIGDPDLHSWLGERNIRQLVLCGIQTNMCVETTARMAGNLGYEVFLPLDATCTFDLVGPTMPDGTVLTATAADLMHATAVNLQGGGFAQVANTGQFSRPRSEEPRARHAHRLRHRFAKASSATTPSATIRALMFSANTKRPAAKARRAGPMVEPAAGHRGSGRRGNRAVRRALPV